MTLQQQIRANRWRTIWLLLLFALLVAGVGLLLAFIFDPTILTVVAIGGIGYAIVSWFASSSMVGRITGAQKIEKRDNPYVYRLLENVSIAAGSGKSAGSRRCVSISSSGPRTSFRCTAACRPMCSIPIAADLPQG